MEGAQAATLVGGRGGGPAPFLMKTYDMVDDSTTDDIVSWSLKRKSFVVWNPPEFARLLLPTYFKHNNFSSFIRQLNTYGFRKIDPERWEFGKEDFVKDQKHLLKNIYRRKPIHSHSSTQGTLDPERTAFEEEIDKLSREKTVLEGNLVTLQHQESTEKSQFKDLTQRVSVMERRQENLLSFLEKSIQSPFFVQRLTEKLESMDVSAYNKRRKLPQVNDSLLDDHRKNSKPEVVNVFNHDFCNKLRLEISDTNLLSHGTQSSNEDDDSPQRKICEPETFEMSDTGTSFNLTMDSPLSQSMGPIEESDGIVYCQLNLSLCNDSNLSSLANNDKKETGISPVRVNDIFWEQFLTEKPECNEEVCPISRTSTFKDHEHKKLGFGMSGNMNSLEHLTL